MAHLRHTYRTPGQVENPAAGIEVPTGHQASAYIQIAYVGAQNRHIESNINSNRVDMVIPTTFAVSPVSPGPTRNDAGLFHDVNPSNPEPTTEDKSVYYDQYPCLSQNNYYNWNEGSNNYNSLQVNYEKKSHNGTSIIAN